MMKRSGSWHGGGTILLARIQALVCAVFTSVVFAADSCESPRVVEPAEDKISESTPEIRWTEVSGAQHYRVRVESRVPEGRTLVSLDTQVAGTRFKPPQPLAEHRAQVSVTVTAYCANGSTGLSDVQHGGRFRIDTSARCVLRGPIRATNRAGELDLSWPAPDDALSYAVALYTPVDGILIGQYDAREPRLRMRLPVAGPVGVAIQPTCRSGRGAPRFTVTPLASGR